MKINEDDLFLGLCFFLSSFSKDKHPESCLISKGRRIVSTGYSSIDLIGGLEGSSEYFAFSYVNSLNLSGFDVYIDHTPSKIVMNYLSKFNFKKLIYFDTEELSFEDSSILSAKIIKFKGNLNWMRDRIVLMKNCDIFN